MGGRKELRGELGFRGWFRTRGIEIWRARSEVVDEVMYRLLTGFYAHLRRKEEVTPLAPNSPAATR